MLNTLIKLCLLALLAGSLLHGYFYIRYGSPHPCVAAQAKLVTTKGLGSRGLKDIQKLNGRDTLASYVYVFTGEFID